MAFHAFHVRLEPTANPDRFWVTTHNPAEGEARASFVSPFGDERIRSWQRGVSDAEAHLIGTLLSHRLFAEPIKRAWNAALRFAQRQGLALRLELMLDPQLENLPWEFLCDPETNQFLARDLRLSIVRHVERTSRIGIKPSPSPLQWMWTNLNDWEMRACANARSDVLPAVLEPLTAIQYCEIRPLDLQHAISTRTRLDNVPHVFYVCARCERDPASGQLALAPGQSDTRHTWLLVNSLGEWLHMNKFNGLLVLHSPCGNFPGAPLETAAALVSRAAAPAALTMQFPIGDAMAQIMMRALAVRLANGDTLDLAVTETRQALAALGSPSEWGAPVLYSALRAEVRLCELRNGSAARRAQVRAAVASHS